VAGAIVPDLPMDEAADLAAICRQHDFSLIQLVAPTTPRDRAMRIAEMSTGFLYYVSVTGITGERRELPESLAENLRWLRAQTQLPLCVGFGISRPEHLRILAPVADGFIVGSAVMKRIADVGVKSREGVVRDVGDFVETLVKAL
jgi:tryptophan synthase alpha chain